MPIQRITPHNSPPALTDQDHDHSILPAVLADSTSPAGGLGDRSFRRVVVDPEHPATEHPEDLDSNLVAGRNLLTGLGREGRFEGRGVGRRVRWVGNTDRRLGGLAVVVEARSWEAGRMAARISGFLPSSTM